MTQGLKKSCRNFIDIIIEYNAYWTINLTKLFPSLENNSNIECTKYSVDSKSTSAYISTISN